MDHLASLAIGVPGLGSCVASSIPFPALRGAEFLGVEANWVTNFTMPIPRLLFPGPLLSPAVPLSFCNVTLAYTHPGMHDRILTQVWLPMDDNVVPWNGQFVGVGGGGFVTGFLGGSAGAVASGYSVVTTDGGHTVENFGDPSTWALASEGNVNLNALQNFASVSLADAAVIGKSVTEHFYNREVDRSYFVGCSTGGRQALMLAQRYPHLYDGYLSGAPAIYFNEFLVTMLRGPVRMVELAYVPPPCEMAEFVRRAVAACDGLDGVEDGIISEPEMCFNAFDPRKVVGAEFECAELGKKLKLSDKGADIAMAVWDSWKEMDEDGNEKRIWDGVGHQGHQADLAADVFTVATTECDYSTGEPICQPAPFLLFMQWLQYFLYETNQPVDITKLTTAELARLLQKSRQLYDSAIRTADPDLSGLRKARGKLLIWHGLADNIIPFNQSRRYYEDVVAFDHRHADDYVRYFEAPGVDHCGIGPGGLFPHSVLQALKDWVEEGKKPEVLAAQTEPDTDGLLWQRMLCRYPKRARYDGKGDVRAAVSYSCK
ncbi:hypothetical protein RB595_007785 [Gaeumannomyces hyphopodioides]